MASKIAYEAHKLRDTLFFSLLAGNLVAETGPIRTASATTQSRANAVSRGLRKNPRFCVTFARVGAAFPVSAAGDDGLRGQNAARSLARANPFPADFIPTDRDAFAGRLRPVRIQSRGLLGARMSPSVSEKVE